MTLYPSLHVYSMYMLHTSNESQTEHGQEEHLQHEVAIMIDNVASYDGDYGKTEVLYGLHTGERDHMTCQSSHMTVLIKSYDIDGWVTRYH